MHYLLNFCRFFVCLFMLVFAANSYAALTPADLAADLTYHEAKISPDGKHLAMTIVHEGKRQLAVLDTNTFASVGGVNFGERQEVGEFHWVSNERLVIKVLVHEPWQEEAKYYGELFAVDYDGKHSILIYGYRAGEMSTGTRLKKRDAIYGWADIISLLPDDEDNILISSTPMSDGGERISKVYRLDVNNGRMSNRLASGPVPYSEFFTDQKGKLRLAIGTDKENKKRVFRFKAKNKTWNELGNDEFGNGFYPLSLDSSAENLFIVDNLDQNKTGLFSLNLKTGSRKQIFTDENVDINTVVFNTTKDSAYALRVEDGYPSYFIFNNASEEAKVFKELLSAFQGHRISITSRSEDGMLWLIHAENDLSAGSYILFDRKNNKFTNLFSNYAELNQKELSESIPIRFQVSDQQMLNGYITYPVSVPETQNVPLVVLVHGGPHTRDYWEFDTEVQLLASQGYAVLRLNFRGSSGYGSKLYFGSQKQWGDRVQKDIIEGTQWVIAQGGILSDKVCIMGASFGGYSAMQSAILAPDLYQCVIANAGVYDLEMMFDEGDIPDRLYGKSYLSQELGTEKSLMRAYSPVHNLQKLKAAVLIAHGEKDRRVPIEQAEALREGMDKHHKAYEWFIKSNETHGFYGQKNRTEYYQKVAEFLGKHLK
ncbi:MAG: dipeptidyl aminopeptidase/acylaminoacyl peptidase [Paraglaciecola sp.]|jgi:dipeptidyl aminopeptidase/acylaminoacyl peptidase